MKPAHEDYVRNYPDGSNEPEPPPTRGRSLLIVLVVGAILWVSLTVLMAGRPKKANGAEKTETAAQQGSRQSKADSIIEKMLLDNGFDKDREMLNCLANAMSWHARRANEKFHRREEAERKAAVEKHEKEILAHRSKPELKRRVQVLDRDHCPFCESEKLDWLPEVGTWECGECGFEGDENDMWVDQPVARSGGSTVEIQCGPE